MILARPHQALIAPIALCSLFVAALALATGALLAPVAKPRTMVAPKRAISAPHPVAASHASPPEQNKSSAYLTVLLSGLWKHGYALRAGSTVEISVHLDRPSTLPPNGRIAVEWSFDESSSPASPIVATPSVQQGRKPDAFEIYTLPTPRWRKVLHALDSDVTVIYRPPLTGKYTLTISPVLDEPQVGNATQTWQDRGHVPDLVALPSLTPWPVGTVAPLHVSIHSIALGDESEQNRLHTLVACEPNDTPEQAQPIRLTPGDGVTTWEITGGSDDIDYFNNGKVDHSGDDWFRLEYKGVEPRMLTAQISMPGQMVAARVRAYRLTGRAPGSGPTATSVWSGPLLSIAEHTDGMDQNERTHQQTEPHRAEITRLLKPGETYFLRVEANAPGYQLQLRLLRPAPYQDPRLAIRQAIYTHIGQVDSWLTNRPRGASLDRRIRETGNLLGTHCMSCHTQSGVWGPAVPFINGYRPENVQNYWHLVDVMYECLRPTNELKAAANNTSLASLDTGDGPAGTRAAGFNIVNLERYRKPGKLHSDQQIRTANYVLQTSDPGGINAAGPGSNVGAAIVHLFSTEILKTAWEKTNDPKYFFGITERAKQMLALTPQFTDDVAVRLDYFNRILPINDLPALLAHATVQAAKTKTIVKEDFGPVDAFVVQVRAQLQQDEARLRAIQNADGTWGFNPGATADEGKTWQRGEGSPDPSPTALAITALTSAGYGKNDPAIAKGVQALLQMQEPSGRWNRAAQTGFVTTAYALHALSRLYPGTPVELKRPDFVAPKKESLLASIKRVQRLALRGDASLVDLTLASAAHESPLVRYWAMIGLGAAHTGSTVPALLHGLGDHAKLVREAAAWGLKQDFLSDLGWNAAFAAYQTGNDDTRAGILQALNMRADAVMPQATLSWSRLTTLLSHAMNEDPHPAVRAWAVKAAWQWWVWNPPVRGALNASWLTLLERPEPNALVENCQRYASQMLFIANGHKANGSREHQYKELSSLFVAVTRRLDTPGNSDEKTRLVRRLVGIGGTFFGLAGGDGGPGQMGYVTQGSGEMLGKAALAYLTEAIKHNDMDSIRAGLEGGANIPYPPLTAFLVDYSLRGPDDLRQLAASAISDPRAVSLAAVPELVEPQLAQILRGAMEPPRRSQISDPIVDLWSKVNWTIPKLEEQQRSFFDLIIPRLNRYTAPEAISAISDPAKRAQTDREMDAAWYLADRLGEVLATNPDLHQEIVFRAYFPTMFHNPIQEHYWLRSVDWLLTFESAPPAVNTPSVRGVAFSGAPPVAQPDAALTIKDRALQLYLDALKPGASEKSRAVAIRMANRTSLRTNPEVLRALSDALAFEKNEELKSIISSVLKQSSEKFVPELMAALKTEKSTTVHFDAAGDPRPTKAQVEDILYFRDYVVPELTRQKRADQSSCMGCHGLPGRVPSMQLHAPDKFGFMAVSDLLFNYRTLQQRVRVNDMEHSKLLRKPLNVQDGKEDGHQGGRRYAPSDPGYLTLRRWAENQPVVQRLAP